MVLPFCLWCRASYKNESCKDDNWFKIFQNFTWADRKITNFAMLQQYIIMDFDSSNLISMARKQSRQAGITRKIEKVIAPTGY